MEDREILEEYIDIDNGALKLWQIDELNKCENLRQAISNILKENENLKEYKEKSLEIDSKEVNDALHMLLHCALKDTEYETQKGQFEIVSCFIKQLSEEINELKAALKINHDLYESKCNQNTKLEEENKELKKVKTDEFILNNPWLFKYLSEVYIPKSLVKEKFQRKRNEIFGCTYVDEEQWKPFDKALDIINDLEQDLLGKEK